MKYIKKELEFRKALSGEQSALFFERFLRTLLML